MEKVTFSSVYFNTATIYALLSEQSSNTGLSTLIFSSEVASLCFPAPGLKNLLTLPMSLLCCKFGSFQGFFLLLVTDGGLVPRASGRCLRRLLRKHSLSPSLITREADNILHQKTETSRLQGLLLCPVKATSKNMQFLLFSRFLMVLIIWLLIMCYPDNTMETDLSIFPQM